MSNKKRIPNVESNLEDQELPLDDEETTEEPAETAVEAPKKAKPQSPSFVVSQGVYDEIMRHGKATDPFTGRVFTKDDLNQ